MPEQLRRRGGSRQPDLIARSKRPKISLPDNHPIDRAGHSTENVAHLLKLGVRDVGLPLVPPR